MTDEDAAFVKELREAAKSADNMAEGWFTPLLNRAADRIEALCQLADDMSNGGRL